MRSWSSHRDILQVNQIPAAATFASKPRLARASAALPFLPRSFVLPQERVQLQAVASESPEKEWLVKGPMHRGVRFLDNVDDAALDKVVAGQEDAEEKTFVQQLIRPYLIDGCAACSRR